MVVVRLSGHCGAITAPDGSGALPPAGRALRLENSAGGNEAERRTDDGGEPLRHPAAGLPPGVLRGLRWVPVINAM